MKRFMCALLVLVCMVSFALAENVDFSSMNYDELILLQKNLVKEIMSRPEWKEVKVPAGAWVVGEDIPAGTYGISTNSALATLTVYKNENKEITDLEGMHVISSDESLGKLVLKDGWVVEITSEVVFTPPFSLGF